MPTPSQLANDPKFQAHVQAWVRKTCPLIFIFAPSNYGKTTLLGSLFPRSEEEQQRISLWDFHREDYCPVFFVDADNGGTTIEDVLEDEDLCTSRVFKEQPEMLAAWTYDRLKEAKTAKCGSIVIEGLIAVHDRLVANEMQKSAKPDSTGAMNNDLRRAYIGASSHAKGLIDTIKQIKQHRIANETGVPIIVTGNCKQVSTVKDKPDSPKRWEPDWGVNLIERAKRASDAHLQLTVDPNGERRLVAVADDTNFPWVKMRSPHVAKIVNTTYDLSLPAMLALWAVEQEKVKRARQKARAARKAARAAKAKAKNPQPQPTEQA